jgi:N-acetylmuramoyl-L-alanine amidase
MNGQNKAYKRLVLVAGHTATAADKGAQATHNGKVVHEGILMAEFQKMLSNRLTALGVSHICDTDNMSTADFLTAYVPQAGDVVIDLHTNAFGDPRARGAEAFVKANASVVERNLAICLLQKLANVGYWLRTPAIKTEEQAARKRLGIMRLPVPVVLMELFFISNPADYERWQFNKAGIALAFADVLYDFVERR